MEAGQTLIRKDGRTTNYTSKLRMRMRMLSASKLLVEVKSVAVSNAKHSCYTLAIGRSQPTSKPWCGAHHTSSKPVSLPAPGEQW